MESVRENTETKVLTSLAHGLEEWHNACVEQNSPPHQEGKLSVEDQTLYRQDYNLKGGGNQFCLVQQTHGNSAGSEFDDQLS